MTRRLDDIDLRILTELQRDGRITFQGLSERVGLSARPCLERVRRLERERVILGYTTRVDVSRLAEFVIVIAQISLGKQGREPRVAFERCIRSRPEVLECFEVSGPFDYVAKIFCPSLAAYQKLTESWLDDPSLHLSRIVSNVVMRSITDSSVYPVTATGVIPRRREEAEPESAETRPAEG